jgi:hypothetical protein
MQLKKGAGERRKKNICKNVICTLPPPPFVDAYILLTLVFCWLVPRFLSAPIFAEFVANHNIIIINLFKTFLHCKKGLAVFPSPAGMSLIKLSLGGNNLIFPAQGEFGQ